jgi:hypothetical protein
MLTHSGPQGLVHRLLYVKLLPFGCIHIRDYVLV